METTVTFKRKLDHEDEYIRCIHMSKLSKLYFLKYNVSVLYIQKFYSNEIPKISFWK